MARAVILKTVLVVAAQIVLLLALVRQIGPALR